MFISLQIHDPQRLDYLEATPPPSRTATGWYARYLSGPTVPSDGVYQLKWLLVVWRGVEVVFELESEIQNRWLSAALAVALAAISVPYDLVNCALKTKMMRLMRCRPSAHCTSQACGTVYGRSSYEYCDTSRS